MIRLLSAGARARKEAGFLCFFLPELKFSGAAASCRTFNSLSIQIEPVAPASASPAPRRSRKSAPSSAAGTVLVTSSTNPPGETTSTPPPSPVAAPPATSNLSPNELRKLFAQLCLTSVIPSSSALAIYQCLLSSGISLPSVKRNSRRGWFERIFSLPLSDVSGKIKLLGPVILSAHPSLFECRMETIQSKVKFFEDLGLRVHKMSSFGRVFKAKLETLEQRVSYLRSVGITPERLSVAVQRYPYVLCASLERTVKPAVRFMEEDCKLSRITICRLIASRPCFVTLSKSNLVEKTMFLESFGIDSTCPQFASSLVELCNLSSARIKGRIDWLMTVGFSPEAIRRLILGTPVVLCCTEANIRSKLDYLLVESNRGIEEILKYPIALAFSLERRIKPRFVVIAQLQERGLLNTYPTLPIILNCSDYLFNRRYVVKLQDQSAVEKPCFP